jgi:hypothetical protein
MSLTTSGTYTYSASAINLLTAALRIAQVIGDEETPTGPQLQNTLDAFAAMIKAWQGTGIHLWCEEECILFLQPSLTAVANAPGQTLYQLGPGSPDHACLFQQLTQTTLASTAAAAASMITLTSAAGVQSGDNIGIQLDAGINYWTTVASTPSGNVVSLTASLPSQATGGAIVFDYTTPLMRPLRVMGGRRYVYSSGIDTPLQMWARLDYQAQPNKMTPGTTTAFFYDPQTGQGAYTNAVGQMNVWPSPQTNQFGMRFTAQRPIQDLGTLANLPDFPVEWNAALKWNLAMEIGPEHGTPVEQMSIIDKQATKYYTMASEWDREPESIMFGVAMQPGYRRG